MTNIEYIQMFAKKHNFPKSNCEVVFNAIDDGSGMDIYTTDDDIVAVRFDKSLVQNEIKIEDIQFDVISNFPEDVFFMWQEDAPEISLKMWISQGRYIPTIVKNVEYFDELERLTKEMEMKLESLFSGMENDEGDSDYEYNEEDEEDGEE